jgi:hypothetical protein
MATNNPPPDTAAPATDAIQPDPANEDDGGDHDDADSAYGNTRVFRFAK